MTHASTNGEVPRDEALSRAWAQASRDEPPAALDDAIRAAAHRAVQAGPRAVGGPVLDRWRVPLSLAAVLVVSATVTLLVAEREAHLPKEAHDLPVRQVAPESEPERSPLPETGQPLMPPKAVVPEAVERHLAAPASAQRKEVQSASEAGRGVAPAPPSSAELADQATPSAAPTPEPAKADAPLMKHTLESKAQSGVRRDEQANQSKAEEELPVERPAERARVQQAAPFPGSAAPAAPAPARSAGMAGEDAMTPQAWIEKILTLRRAGKDEEARRSLEQFQHRYPDFPLPPELAPAH